MKLSKRTRYGVRMMLELALEYGKDPVQISEIAKKEEISQKYLSQLIIPLKNAGLVTSIRGASGGYVLARPPGKITLEDVFRILEGEISLVECIGNPKICSRTCICITRDIWNTISSYIETTLHSITLEELVARSLRKTGTDVFVYQI